VTRILCIALLVVTLVSTFTQRVYGIGVSNLNFQVDRVLALELWRIVTYPFVESSPYGLILSLIFLWLLGGSFEARWGERDFLRFFILSSIGGALFAIPLSFIIDLILPFRDMGFAEGPSTGLDALLVALALTSPDTNVMFGFVLPIRARTVVLIILGFQLVSGIMTGAAQLSATLGGMAMGYLLVTGNWRPQRWLGILRTQRMRRRGLYVVPPRKDHTLH
jgi:membrane associated rhomboid family serine protease